MTETPTLKPITPSARRRKNAKRAAWQSFFAGSNSLTLIAATLIPPVMYMTAQGICSMVYMAIGSQAVSGRIADIASIVDFILIFLMLPLAGGTWYIATGLAQGEGRHLRDIFYAYTSWRAHCRAWIGILVPVLAMSAVGGAATAILTFSQGLTEIASAIEAGKPYAYLFWDGGIVLAGLVATAGLVLCSYVMPFLWLTFAEPSKPLSALLPQSFAVIRGHLWEWLLLHLGFLGWLLLSAATVGVLLVLFTAPYYLLTVSFYIRQSENRLSC